MSKHTNRPWIVSGLPDRYNVEFVNANGPQPIAQLIRSDNPNWAADARLIAAAPELLAELRSIKSWMEDCLIDKQQRGLPSRERYDAVCAVIAKAT